MNDHEMKLGAAVMCLLVRIVILAFGLGAAVGAVRFMAEHGLDWLLVVAVALLVPLIGRAAISVNKDAAWLGRYSARRVMRGRP